MKKDAHKRYALYASFYYEYFQRNYSSTAACAAVEA